ncbi:exodeoxyribonuclease VII small subunit [Desulfocurvus sp. DL9XJH121]
MAKAKDTFESRLARLREIVDKLESRDLPLEDGVALFKEGVELAKACRVQLEKARNDVKILMNGSLADFAAEEDDA